MSQLSYVAIKLRRDSSDNWSANNPVLKLGEPGIETDTRKLKFGDGSTPWNDLGYTGIDIGDPILLEGIDDRVANLIKAGSNISISYSDNTDELVISATGLQVAGNYATLVNGKVPADQLPGYIDDVVEYPNFASFPQVGESNKIYVSLDNNKTYRWSGSAYIDITSGNYFDQDLNTTNSPAFDTITISGSQIFGGGENSGDGNNKGTLELVPDNTLYNNDQYLIVDPTAPNHIHLRAGGNQDNSNAQLIIGGENSNISVMPGNNPNVAITAQNNTWLFSSNDQTYYVMANVDGNIVTSNDGINWNGAFSTGMNINHVATNGDVIVAIGSAQQESVIGYTSFASPGYVTTLNPSVSGLSNIILTQIVYAGGYFVISGFGNDGNKTVPCYAYSSNGSTWIIKFVEGQLADILANNNGENCIFSDVDYNGVGWNFSVVADNVGGGVYTTDINETLGETNYFGMVPGYQVAWNGNAWYYINSNLGSGFNTSLDPRQGNWVGPFNPWESSQQDLGINIVSQASDTFCGGNGLLAFSDSSGHVSFSSNNGIDWTYVTPVPYAATVTNIVSVDNKLQITITGDFTSHANGEKITISGSSVQGYNGTYYLNDQNFLYTDYQLTTPFVAPLNPFAGTANLTWSHGQYIDAMDYVNGYFYIGNDDEQIARSSNLANWYIVDDRNNMFEYWNDFSGYSKQYGNVAQFITPNGGTLGSFGMGWPGFYNSNMNMPVSVASRNVSNGAPYASMTAYQSQGDSGEVNINVASTGVSSYHNWNFTNDGTLQLASGGIKFADNTVQTTAGGGGVSGTTLSNLNLTNVANQINYFVGEPVTFTKSDNGNEADEIDTNLTITRGNNQGIYNSELENSWGDETNVPFGGRPSPANTVWNSDGWTNLTNVNTRAYVGFWTSAGGSLGNNVLSKNFIMKDVVNNKYYKIDFTVWGNTNSGAPVSYTRQQIDGITGNDIGSLITFVKPGGADPFLVYDDIDTGLKISRGSNQGIFNIEEESGWQDNSNWEVSPLGTVWNIDGWQDLSNVKSRVYQPLEQVFDGGLGQKIVNTECVMHDTINDKYYTVKFTKWGNAESGAGVSYVRRLINTDFVFIHTEDGNEVDQIDEGIAITRDSNYGIYNPQDEGSWDEEYSPGGTLWNFDGFQDLSNLQNRSYVTFFEAIRFWGIGNKIDGAESIMKVPSTGKYYTVKWLSWQRGGGGAFSYIRTEIDLSKLNEGIRFPDGTVQKTSANNIVKFKGPVYRSIQEYYGYASVDVTQAQAFTVNSTIKFTVNNSSGICIVTQDANIAEELGDLKTIRNLVVSLDNGASWVHVRHGGWGNSNGYYLCVYTKDGSNPLTGNAGDAIKLKYWRGGVPQLWFDPDNSPGGYGNFRGAIIDYHAYSNDDGTIIGQIMVSCDGGDYNVTHSECLSGSNDLANVILWYSEPRGDTDNEHREGQLYAYKADGNNDTIKIQWKATMFYGQEYWD